MSENVVPYKSDLPPERQELVVRGAYKKRAMKSGEIAARVRERMLEALENEIIELEVAQDHQGILGLVTGENLRLIADAENRGFGTPTQSVQVKGDPTAPLSMIHSAMTPEEAADAYRRSLDETA